MSDPGPDPIGWHHNPTYSIDFDPLPARVQAVLNGETVADTTAARVMYELVWWRDASGDEWQARIKDRVLEATALRADGDATPYG